MAAVHPSPRTLSNMANRRIPLANNPNAANSPFRNVPQMAGKRSRAQVDDARDLLRGQPPLKKQYMDLTRDENSAPNTLTRQSQADRDAEDQLFSRKLGHAPNAFERKLAAVAKEKKAPSTAAIQRVAVEVSPEKSHATGNSLEEMRKWQAHYKKQFPGYVLFFDSIPDDIRRKVSAQTHFLGAKEEKFFSKAVTHIITTRPVPPEHPSTSSQDKIHPSHRLQDGSKTIDPAVLDRYIDAHTGALKRTSNLLESTLQSRLQNVAQQSQRMDPRRPATQSTDVLTRARDFGIKIWTLDKLHRMLEAIFNLDTGEGAIGPPLTRSQATNNLVVERQGKEADLQRLLRNEKINGPADRDLNVSAQDMCQLKGYYIYLHDMDEKTRPVMTRDYHRPAVKEQGKWPQFRASGPGRCPFIEDRDASRRLAADEQRKAEVARAQREANSRTRTTRATAALEVNHHPALAELQPNLRRSPRKLAQESPAKPLDPPKVPASRQNSADGMPALFGSAQANLRNMPRFTGREPVASGVQPSNITSAIRSQIISSTAISSTAPGARIGSSKEIHALKRKVLERGGSMNSGQTLTSSYMNDMRAALNGDGAPAPRAAKRKAQETLGFIHEEIEGEDGEIRIRKIHQSRKKTIAAPKDPKPGYCENCRDKFDDFDEHIGSRKHRKFALSHENWTQLDDLLGKLERPLKDVID